MADQGSAVKRFIRKLEVPPPKGDNYATTLWVNSDLIPLSSARRTWGSWKYVVYWATGGKTLVQNFVLVSVTGLTILLPRLRYLQLQHGFRLDCVRVKR